MVFSRYNYPLPNNGTGYSFSEQELIKLLDSVYDQGYKHGVESTIEPETVTATYRDLTVSVPVRDPDLMWNTDNNYNIMTPYMKAMLNGEKYDDTVKIYFAGEDNQ